MMRVIAGSGLIRMMDGDVVTGSWDDGADGRLYARLMDWGDPWLGLSVFGLGYDLDNDGGSFVSGYEGNENGYPTDSDDHYAEGWYTGYWSYWLEDDFTLETVGAIPAPA